MRDPRDEGGQEGGREGGVRLVPGIVSLRGREGRDGGMEGVRQSKKRKGMIKSDRGKVKKEAIREGRRYQRERPLFLLLWLLEELTAKRRTEGGSEGWREGGSDVPKSKTSFFASVAS